MKVKEFNTILENNLNKELLFEYSNGKLVGANYHLTEIKNVNFDTVDCGGKSNQWNETQFQLWESPKEIHKRNYLTVDKIKSIIKRVDAINPIDIETTLKIEYGNHEFHTSVLDIEDIETFQNKIVVKLFANETLCKANIIESPASNENMETEPCCTQVGCC